MLKRQDVEKAHASVYRALVFYPAAEESDMPPSGQQFGYGRSKNVYPPQAANIDFSRRFVFIVAHPGRARPTQSFGGNTASYFFDEVRLQENDGDVLKIELESRRLGEPPSGLSVTGNPWNVKAYVIDRHQYQQVNVSIEGLTYRYRLTEPVEKSP